MQVYCTFCGSAFDRHYIADEDDEVMCNDCEWEMIAEYEDEHPYCSCRYCNCMDRVEGGGICGSCSANAHQG